MTLLEFLDRFPPNLCRLVARKQHGFRPLTTREIAKKGGVTLHTVVRVSKMTTWKGLRIETIVGFTKGCGINHLSPIKKNDSVWWAFRFLKKSKLTCHKKATSGQRRLYMELWQAKLKPAGKETE